MWIFRYRYNKAHIATRNSIERAFGVWKRRFPCLDMKMQYKPERAVTIITACAALHNLGRKMCDPCPPSQSPPSSPSARRATSRPLPPPPPPPQNSPSGVQIRQNLITRSFTWLLVLFYCFTAVGWSNQIIIFQQRLATEKCIKTRKCLNNCPNLCQQQARVNTYKDIGWGIHETNNILYIFYISIRQH